MNSRIQSSLSRLQEGNTRFISGVRSVDAIASNKKLQDLAEKGQKPFAGFIACADSRVPAELVFDCGLGELFVCRVAGNIVTSEVVASLEYGVVALGTPLIVVLGHSLCGAVDAALKGKELPTPHLNGLARQIDTGGQKDWQAAVQHNAEAQRRRLLEMSEELRKREKAGEIAVVSAVYDLRTGQVAFSESMDLARAA